MTQCFNKMTYNLIYVAILYTVKHLQFPTFFLILRKKLETIRKRPLEADLIEVLGKKSKPLWHIVALEPPVDPLLRYVLSVNPLQQIDLNFKSSQSWN